MRRGRPRSNRKSTFSLITTRRQKSTDETRVTQRCWRMCLETETSILCKPSVVAREIVIYTMSSFWRNDMWMTSSRAASVKSRMWKEREKRSRPIDSVQRVDLIISTKNDFSSIAMRRWEWRCSPNAQWSMAKSQSDRCWSFSSFYCDEPSEAETRGAEWNADVASDAPSDIWSTRFQRGGHSKSWTTQCSRWSSTGDDASNASTTSPGNLSSILSIRI